MSIDINETAENFEKTVIAPAQDMEATLMGTTVVCPICSTENPPGEQYCGECGFLLSSAPGEEPVEVDMSGQPRLTDASTGIEHFLQDGDNTIGRESADVLINDPAVSRKHALITLENGKCRIEDLGSTNGTYVRGSKIQPSVKTDIADGDEIKIGSTALILNLPVVDAGDEGEVIDLESTDVVIEASEEQVVQEPVESDEAVEEEAVEPVALLVKSSDQSVAYEIMPGTNSIGRRSGNDIQIVSDPYISGSHAEIIAEDGKIWITDVGSTNGTILDGTRLAPNVRAELGIGSEITFGQTQMRLTDVENDAEDAQSESE